MPPAAVLGAAGLFSAAESGLGIGVVVPGETAVLIAGAAVHGKALLITLFVVVTLAASCGDHVGYVLGRRYGERLREAALLRRITDAQWDRAVLALRRRGAWAVFLTRLLPVIRTLTPAAAGMAQVRYAHFLPASLAGAATWSALYVFGGALAGASAEQLGAYLGTAGWAVIGVLAVPALVVWALRRRRTARRAG
ncbi:membrane protein [Streptomyces showdoensis]|uniref:Membrane protein n=2 Tax=Streptomyces showdoensis TaxID=68268 RepID=A0A2P2GHS2_STREW|nr:membrane protein [Streptomyces showdoensis]